MRILAFASVLLATNQCLKPRTPTPATNRASHGLARLHSRLAWCASFAVAKVAESSGEGENASHSENYKLHVLADPEDADVE